MCSQKITINVLAPLVKEIHIQLKNDNFIETP